MRINNLFLLVAALLLCVAAPAQTVVSGTVRYVGTSGEPGAGVGVMLMSLDGKSMLGFQNADATGAFSLTYRGNADSLLLRCNALDIKPLERRIAARTQQLALIVESAPLSITEARVKEPPMRQHGDTLVYTVSQYRDSTDRSIGEVLQKMPGFTVEKSGKILYNGKEINRFYIEGMDMLGRGYGVATNNIRAADIASVEVYERHQPVRALESLERPDQAALNLKLKDSARGTWTTTLDLGSGYKPWMWNAEAVTMYFTRKVQTMLTYKTNNTGDDVVVSELLSFETPPIENAASMLHLRTPFEPPVDVSRYLLNKVHAVSANVLTQLRPTVDFSARASYIHDHQTSEGRSLTRYYFLQQQPLEVEELIASQILTDQAEVSLRLVDNTTTHYLDERMNVSGRKYDGTGTIGSINQQLRRPAFSVENRFSDLIRLDEQVYSVTSNTSYTEGEASLRVSPLPFTDLANETTPNAVQQLHTRRFDSQNNLRWSQNIGYWQMTVRTHFNARVESLQSAFMLADRGLQTLPAADSMANAISLRRFDLILAPRFEYNTGDPFRISIDLPLDARFTNYADQRERHLHFLPRLSISGEITTNLRYNLDARLTSGVGGVNSLYMGYMMTD
ncbi:MAG: Plug domain-containing protein, partial [Bacteroidales bacterium]|nr:Plug domain-containing protein [Bacteroidales bacterium]